MRFVYSVINLLILAAILWFAGRKTIVKMFRSRRENIVRELDEAEEPFKAEPLPEAKSVDDAPYRAELAAAQSEEARSAAEIDAQYEADREDLRREMLLSARARIIREVLDLAEKHMRSDEYRATQLDRQSRAVDQILRQIHLTPGDISYLKQKGVLYVTLTSASKLDGETVEKVRQKAQEMLDTAGGEMSFWVREDPELIGGLRLRIGDTIYDYTISNKLYRLGKALNDRPLTETDAESIRAGMLDAVHGMKLGIDVFQVGRVLTVSDGICWLDGVADIMYGELVEFTNGERGMVMDIQSDKVGCIIFGRYDHVESYSRVRRLNKMASVPVGEALIGRVVDALGKPIDGKGRIWSTESRPIEFQAPAIPDRQSVSVPLHTGITAIDALVPIGRGQRELIIGDRQTGKSAIVEDTILAQKGQNVICIYVAIGQKRSTVAQMAAHLEAVGAMEYTTIVSATASDSASLQYIAPFSGAAMSEYFMYSGKDVLIIYDDLSKHAVAYREISLLLHRPSGREAYPGDIFYLHSRLLERAARLNAEAGGGSVTALPIIETQAGDISAYIPTNVISITDGQIFLEADLFNEGQRPAVNVGLSVSRVGGAAQTKLMKQVASSLRTGLAQYRELASFTQFGSDLDESTRRTLAAGAKMMAALRQNRYSPIPDWQQALLIYTVANGFADKVDNNAMEEFAARLFAWFPMHESGLTETLKTGSKLTEETKSALNAALASFAEAY
jgi:F-type H+/Na+-transporting ATPase subunit alpha